MSGRSTTEPLEDDEIFKRIGVFVRAKRFEMGGGGWTQDELSIYSLVSVSTIKRIERGYSCDTRNLIAILRAMDSLNVLGDLITGMPVDLVDQIMHKRVKHREE